MSKTRRSPGVEFATYSYDAWGNVTDTVCNEEYEIAYNLNHITYRGYYRDEESGFYYLQSRYYDPVVGRFINADDVNVIGIYLSSMYSDNLYIYCNSNPVNSIDPYGYFEFSSTKKYYTLKLNDWETDTLLKAVNIGLVAAEIIIATIALASPELFSKLGLSAASIAIMIAGVIFNGVIDFINHIGGSKGININYGRKWYTPHYIWANKKEPKGYNSIWDVFNKMKSRSNEIVKLMGKNNLKK